jgi:hypothetical protein
MQEQLFPIHDDRGASVSGPDISVYVIYAVGTRHLKIGYGTEPRKRLTELQMGSPVPLRLLWSQVCHDAAAVERSLHKQCAQYRLRGEWFELPKNVPAALGILSGIFQSLPEPDRQPRPQLPEEWRPALEAQLLPWLGEKTVTSWHEIATDCLGLATTALVDRVRQKHVAKLLSAAGWHARLRRRGTKIRREWYKVPMVEEPPEESSGAH